MLTSKSGRTLDSRKLLDPGLYIRHGIPEWNSLLERFTARVSELAQEGAEQVAERWQRHFLRPLLLALVVRTL